MGRARQIASSENMDRIILDSSDGTADAGDFLLLDASAAGTDAGFFINTEIGTTETPPDGFVNSSSIATDAVTSTKIADLNVTGAKIETGVSLANGLTLTDGNLTVASGHGIDFSGTADGTGTASTEVFDDYEEGTWTPAVVGATNTPGFHNNVGRYTRIGREVTLQFFQQASGSPTATFSNNSANFQISGVPFSVFGHGYTGSQGTMNSQAFHYNSSNNTQGMGADFVSPSVTGSDYIEFQTTGSGATRGIVNNTGMRAGVYVIEATITYFTDA